MYDAVRKHAGLAILPCFIGDTDSGLTRASAPLSVAAVAHHLLVHQDLRNLPVVRAMMDVLIELYESRRDLLAGKSAGHVAA